MSATKICIHTYTYLNIRGVCCRHVLSWESQFLNNEHSSAELKYGFDVSLNNASLVIKPLRSGGRILECSPREMRLCERTREGSTWFIRRGLCLVLTLCASAQVWKCSLLFVTNFMNAKRSDLQSLTWHPLTIWRFCFCNVNVLCKISGFHGGDYGEWRLVGCCAVWHL
jgi:hypothetical protein